MNYLALLGWSPGEGEEVAADRPRMARRFDARPTVAHSAAVFDTAKLAWMNRHYMKEAAARAAGPRGAAVFRARRVSSRTRPTRRSAYVESLLPMAVGSVDRLEEIPERVAFVFEWERRAGGRARARRSRTGLRAVAAFGEAIATAGAARHAKRFARRPRGRVRQTALKGRALFHPIRVALTAAESGPELDLAVPAIDRGAALGAGARASLPMRRAPIASRRSCATVVDARLTGPKVLTVPVIYGINAVAEALKARRVSRLDARARRRAARSTRWSRARTSCGSRSRRVDRRALDKLAHGRRASGRRRPISSRWPPTRSKSWSSGADGGAAAGRARRDRGSAERRRDPAVGRRGRRRTGSSGRRATRRRSTGRRPRRRPARSTTCGLRPSSTSRARSRS